MPANATEIGARVMFDPARAKKELVAAWGELRSLKLVAERYGVNRSTIWRWMQTLEIDKDVAWKRELEAAKASPGKPRAPKQRKQKPVKKPVKSAKRAPVPHKPTKRTPA